MFVRTYTSENADTFSSISGDHIVCRVSVRNEMLSTCLFSIFRKLPPPRPQGVLSYSNRPFPSYKNPHFQNEGKCKIEFCLHKNIEYFSYKKLRTSPQWGRDRRALPRIFRLFWISSKKSLLNSSHPKLSQNRKFQTPQKPSIISVTWIRISPLHRSPPRWDSASLCHRALGQLGNGLLEREDPGNEEAHQWRHTILDSDKRTNKKRRNYFSRRINGHRK